MFFDMSLLKLWEKIADKYMILFWIMKSVGTLGVLSFVVLTYFEFIRGALVDAWNLPFTYLFALLGFICISFIQEFTVRSKLSVKLFMFFTFFWYGYTVFMTNLIGISQLSVANIFLYGVFFSWFVPVETYWRLRSWPSERTPLCLSPIVIVFIFGLMLLAYYPIDSVLVLPHLPLLVVVVLIRFASHLWKKLGL
jgi:hypothetical protein